MYTLYDWMRLSLQASAADLVALFASSTEKTIAFADLPPSTKTDNSERMIATRERSLSSAAFEVLRDINTMSDEHHTTESPREEGQWNHKE